MATTRAAAASAASIAVTTARSRPRLPLRLVIARPPASAPVAKAASASSEAGMENP